MIVQNETKPGWKTTEFWLVLLTNVTVIFGQLVDVIHIKPQVAAAGLIVLNGLYSIARGLAKKGVAETVVTPLPELPVADEVDKAAPKPGPRAVKKPTS